MSTIIEASFEKSNCREESRLNWKENLEEGLSWSACSRVERGQMNSRGRSNGEEGNDADARTITKDLAIDL